MKVVLKETVVDRIIAKLTAAQADWRLADYIVVTHKEYDEMCADQRSLRFMDSGHMRYSPEAAPHAVLDTKDFPKVGLCEQWGQPYIRAVSYESFMGVKVYVVPEAYCPR